MSGNSAAWLAANFQPGSRTNEYQRLRRQLQASHNSTAYVITLFYWPVSESAIT